MVFCVISGSKKKEKLQQKEISQLLKGQESYLNDSYLLVWVRRKKIDLFLTEFEGRTVSYGPGFSPIGFMAEVRSARDINRRGKNGGPQLTVRTEKTRLVRYLLYLYRVSDGFRNDFYSHTERLQISDAPRTAKLVNLKSLVGFNT